MRRLILAATCAGVLLGVAPAAGRGSVAVFGFGVTGLEGVRLIRVAGSDIHIRGGVDVDFHGDAGAGCEARHMCDVRGTVRWAPNADGVLIIVEYSVRGRRRVSAGLFLDTGGNGGTAVASRVERTRPDGGTPVCTDAGSSGVNAVDLVNIRGGAIVRLASPDSAGSLLGTRCGGPLGADVLRPLPARRLSLAALRHGRWSLDFSGAGSFSSHGLVGTVESRLRLRSGATYSRAGASPTAPSSKAERRRQVAIRYRVERISGVIAVPFAGLADTSRCAPLGACDTTGKVTLAPRSADGAAYVTASAPATRPSSDLRAALGLGAGRRGGAVDVYGEVHWTRGAGAATAELQTNGGPTCSDVVPVGHGTVLLRRQGNVVHASYGPDFYAADPLLTRCPGPRLADVTARRSLASGTFPLRALGRRRLVLRLRAGAGGFAGDGYRGRSTSNVVIVLRRQRVTEQTYVAQWIGG